MEQHTYDNESVQELLDWAKKWLRLIITRQRDFRSISVQQLLMAKHYLETLIAMISRNWENPTFHPTIEQLWEFRESGRIEAHK